MIQVGESLMVDAERLVIPASVRTVTTNDVNLPSVLAIICAAAVGNHDLRERVDMLLCLQERVRGLFLSYCSR